MCSSIQDYLKKLFQGIASIILSKGYVSGNVKDNVTKSAKLIEMWY